MGAMCSAESAAGPKRRGSLRKEQTARNLAINEKIKEALKLKIEEQKKLEHPITLERILLKFDKLNDVLGYVKDVFDQLSPNGNPLGADDLYKALQMLKGRSSKEEVDSIFHFSDLEQNTKVNLKEFVVALTVAIVLGNVDFGTEKVKLAASPRRASISSFFGHPKEVYEMLQLIISAYLLFDTQGVGYIERDRVEVLLEETGHKQGTNSMLTNERWKELDWDDDGKIDLAEFVNAFTKWVDFDNVLGDDDE
jgi:Ca2+-binding EF-hand superfamily protein